MNKEEKKIANQLEDLVGRRFNLKTLESKLTEIFGHKAKVEDISRDDDELADYNLLTLIDNKKTGIYAYADIYYLKMRRKGFDNATIYITEVGIEFE
jgi:hypothetical protein